MASLLRRLRALDRIVLLVVFPIWLLFFGAHVARWLTCGLAEPAVYVTDPAECPAYPVVRTLRVNSPAQDAGLRPGDELLRIGDRDLSCTGSVGFFAKALEAMGRDQRAELAYRRDGQTLETVLSFTPLPLPVRFAVVSAGFALTGLLLLLRAPRSRSATSLCSGFLLLSFGFLRPWGGPVSLTYALLAIVAIISAFSAPAVVRAAIAFPDDAIPHAKWTRWIPWLFVPVGPLYLNGVVGIPLLGADAHFSKPLSDALLLVLNVVVVVFITSNYFRCDSLGRRQIRWAVAGIYLAMAPIAVATAISVVSAPYWWLSDASEILLVLVPIALLIAILRYNLFDIDRLITAAASYSLLSGGVVLIGATLFPKLSHWANTALGIDSAAGNYVVATGLAVAVVGGNRLLQPVIERRLFPSHQTLLEGIEDLLNELPAIKLPRELAVRAAERIDELFHPQSCAIFVRDDAGFAAVFSRGAAVPPHLASTHPIVAALHGRVEPLVAERWSRGLKRPLSPFDGAVLESLDAALLFPVVLRSELQAFESLGPKRSGDIYTKREIELVRTVVSSVALLLERFDQTAMQESLRRYVPGAIAGELAAGKELAPSVREVTVMFVDIRGYTSYSEGREASEIFSTVSGYTQRVSEVVTRHGGTIVEFNGDGMMTVFGAPNELASKESAGVRAGLEILQSLDAAPLLGTGTTRRISVGVGIATGEVYAGSIRAVDRLIWTAIGNTTNLASRLQSLTRTLDASMAIEGTTAARIGSLRSLFEKQADVRIAGRSELIDVFVLRRSESDR